jgi:class 3 adenylate cyclase
LSEVRAPTLIAHRFGFALVPVDVLRELSAEIPNASLVVLEGETADVRPLYSPQMRQVLDEFLLGAAAQPIDVDAPSPAATEGSRTLPSGTAVILFADIADSTALTERLGDAAFRAKARDLDASLRGVIRDHSGTPIEGKLLGDGVLAVFTSARQAIEAALACARSGDDAGLPLHLGLHAGDVIREENNVYGGAVNIASRISSLSAPGDVLVSDVVRTLARTSAGVRFEDRGEQSLKGVGEQVRVWRCGRRQRD